MAAATVPPHNLEAEAAVLGAMLMSEHAIDAIMLEVRLRPEDFWRDRHRAIFGSIIRLRDRTDPEPTDPLGVCEDLRRHSELDQAGGEDYVHALPEQLPSLARAVSYAGIVKRNALMRGIVEGGRALSDEALSFAGDPRELVERGAGELLDLVLQDARGDLRPMGEVVGEQLDRLSSAGQEGIKGTRTGYDDLDRLLGGLHPGNLIIVAARPSMGKSALVTGIAEGAAMKHGRPVALFSLEMSEAEIAERFIAGVGRVDGDRLRKGTVSEREWPKVLRAAEQLANAPIYVDDSSDIGVLEIRAKARRLHMREPLGLVIVDYLQLLRAEDPRAGRVEQVGQMSRSLKILARELKVPVIALAQVSRRVEENKDHRPTLAHLRESGQIEQDADVVAFIYKDPAWDDEGRENERELIIAKHRNGPLGTVDLVFVPRYVRFASRAREAA